MMLIYLMALNIMFSIVTFAKDNEYMETNNLGQEQETSNGKEILVIDLKDKTEKEQKEILKSYGIEYKEDVDYEKIEEVAISNDNLTALDVNGSYNGKQYKIYYLHYNEVKSKKVTGENAILGAILDRGISIAIGFTTPYLWVPYTLLGITPSSIGAKNDPANYVSTSINIHTVEKNFGFVNNGTIVPYAVFQRLELADTTTSYLLVDEQTKRYRPNTGEKNTFYEASNYRNDSYGLQRAEEMWIRNIREGYFERADVSDERKVHTLSYQTHVQNIGWQGLKKDGEFSGTSGKSLRLEGIKINITNNGLTGNIQYRTHVQNLGWQDWVSNGSMSGTSGKGLRLEAIQIRLTGQLKDNYDVTYRTHVQNLGWQGWVKNGSTSGTSGKSLRLEAIQIRLLAK